ncbi:hypothetical protein PIB30_097409 [Stylosanthes scabra]|uniref:Uncharacterized protein n=1 Tax=Stylosanthes scabra TaxID=79078 RepID=A0ABU6SYP4_9FABA|nr:hypothetical protein [Stylosanthes scabra]
MRNDKEKKLGTEIKETEEETEKQKKKQRKKTVEEKYKKQRKQKPRASRGEHRSRLDQVTTWSKRDTHWKEGSSTHQAKVTLESRFGLAKRDPNVKVTKGRTSSRFGHVTTWSKRELCNGSPRLATTPSSHVSTTPQHGPNVTHV